jgi:hypothetical protein
MPGMPRRFVVILIIVLLVPTALLVLFLVPLGKNVPSNVLDFHPSSFAAKANSSFFYSVGDELKFADQIAAQSPTLARGNITDYMVAPDAKKIAVVVNGILLLVDGEKHDVRQVTPVDSIYKEPKPLGHQFFRDEGIQWTKDSQSLYLVKDEYYESKGSQLYSQKGELWRYDLESQRLQLVLKPFPAYTYFFGLHGIYFSVPTEQGDLRIRYFDGQSIRDVGDVNAWGIPSDNLAPGFIESPFFSFSNRDFNELYSRGARLEVAAKGGPGRLVIGGKTYLALSEGEGFKGAFYCANMRNSVFLPGRRYFLFDVPYCKNYEGQLLVDTANGQYQQLPPKSRVYLTLNTNNVPTYRVSSGGMLAF